MTDESPSYEHQERSKLNSFFRFLYFLFILSLYLAGAGFGIYLATLVIPIIMTALASAGIPYWAALLIGILASIYITEAISQWWVFPGRIKDLYSLLYKILTEEKLENFSKQDMALCHLLIEFLTAKGKASKLRKVFVCTAALASIGLTIFLSIAIVPHIIAILANLGLAYGFAAFTGILSGIAIYAMMGSLFFAPISFFNIMCGTKAYLSKIRKLNKSSHGGYLLGFFALMGTLAGVGLGVYLSLLVSPPLLSSLLTLPTLSYGFAMLATIAVCIFLVLTSYFLFSRVGFALGSFFGRIEKAALKSDEDKDFGLFDTETADFLNCSDLIGTKLLGIQLVPRLARDAAEHAGIDFFREKSDEEDLEIALH